MEATAVLEESVHAMLQEMEQLLDHLRPEEHAV
jgi:hypothetical protein